MKNTILLILVFSVIVLGFSISQTTDQEKQSYTVQGTNYNKYLNQPIDDRLYVDNLSKDMTTLIPNDYSDSGRYFPLKIGNRFYFKYKYTFHRSDPDSTASDSSYYISKITDTIRINGKRYYKINLFLYGELINYWRYNIDSGNFVMYDSAHPTCNFERTYFSFILTVGQYGPLSCCFLPYLRCYALKDTTAFGQQKKLKAYNLSMGSQSYSASWNYILLKDLGLSYYKNIYNLHEPGIIETATYDLIGAFVNGVKYGDTNTIGIRKISSTVPDKFELSQNYPNPFNPTTNIKYSIPKLSSLHAQELSSPNAPIGDPLVVLKVFDILGREVETLVNEKQSPGTYEVTFDGSKLSSGIYFYTLTAGDFKETKKLILLK